MHVTVKVQIQPNAREILETVDKNLDEIDRLVQENAALLQAAVRFDYEADVSRRDASSSFSHGLKNGDIVAS